MDVTKEDFDELFKTTVNLSIQVRLPLWSAICRLRDIAKELAVKRATAEGLALKTKELEIANKAAMNVARSASRTNNSGGNVGKNGDEESFGTELAGKMGETVGDQVVDAAADAVADMVGDQLADLVGSFIPFGLGAVAKVAYNQTKKNKKT